MKKWTLFIALVMGLTGYILAGDGGDGKAVREHGHACYWSEPNTFDSHLAVPDDQEDGGKETQMRYVCHEANYPIVRARNFIAESQPDTWVADGRDKHYSLTRW